MSIGVILFDLKNSYFSQISNTISLSARKHGYFTYVAVTEKDKDSEWQILHNLASRRVDGIIMLPINQGESFINELKSLEIPIVTIGNCLPGIHHVSIDDFKAAYDSAKFIHRAGYKRICFICPPLRKKGTQDGLINIDSQYRRAQGFECYMKNKAKTRYEILTEKEFSPIAISMVRDSTEKIAFFCSSDIYALELLKNFRDSGISIPRDAGLMGFDNLDILTYINPRITTVSTSIEEVGQMAMDKLFSLISGESIEDTYYVPHQICPGETL
ncbi:LacI family transcriptional regulator [Treponema sp. OttesenSCG-928-L16]|nr:LacI family transcriptional regulator [Treponema sp. OttesenSCG-928-L16]